MLKLQATLLAAAMIYVTPAMAAGLGPTAPSYIYGAQVIGVLDGDTVDLDIDLGFYMLIKKQRIQLLGVDAPEAKDPTKAAGAAATDYLRKLIDGKKVIIETARGNDPADRDQSFGNWLATIYLDGVDVNEEMIKSGHAVKASGQ